MIKLAIYEAAGNLLAYRQRSLLALIGILIGSGAVISMINVGAMARNETLKQFQQMGIDIVSLRSPNPAGISLPDVQALSTNARDLAILSPVTANGSTVAVLGGRVVNTNVAGVTDTFERIAKLRRRDGRFLSAFDRFELFCVVGSKLADDFARSGNPIRAGSNIRIGRYVFRVISVLQPIARSAMLQLDINDTILMSISNAKRVLDNAPINQVLAQVRAGAVPTNVSEELQAYFQALPQRSKMEVESAQQLIDAMSDQMRLFQLLLGAVGGIALILGGVGVMNIMLVSVQERQQEIGIRLAVGARQRDIQLLFLSESIVLSILGALLGAGLGIGASYVFAQLSGWDLVNSLAAVPLGCGISIGTGVFFGFYPAFMASRLDPIVALRSE